jgi:hypothetical protein
MDLETRKIKNKLVPYTICIFDGKEKKSYYLSDFNNSEEMLKESIKYLIKRKYKGYKVYFHNFSNFDGIFYIKILSDLSNNIKPIIKDNEIINLTVKFIEKNNIYFRDSYLMLPESLKDLAKSFKVEDKTLFPYNFVNKSEIPLNYIGSIPEYKDFSKVTVEEYNLKYKGKSKNYWKRNKFNGITPEIYENYCKEYKDKNK